MYHEFVRGFSLLIGYFAVCVALVFVLRKFVTLPKEVARKSLHMILLGSVFIWVYGFNTWWVAALAALVFMALVFPILAVAEKWSKYAEMLVERKPGEIKGSLIAVCLTFALLIFICWGALGQRYLVIAAVLGWGLGDAAAALVGKRFGKHIIEGPFVEGRKSLEGTLAMFAVSFTAVLLVLVIHGVLPWYAYVPTAGLTALVCALVELYTRNGMDTVTCPLAAISVLIPLLCLWGA